MEAMTALVCNAINMKYYFLVYNTPSPTLAMECSTFWGCEISLPSLVLYHMALMRGTNISPLRSACFVVYLAERA